MEQKSKNIKRTPKGVGSTQKSYHFYIDDDLIAVVDAQANKTRFINAAIRKFIKKLKKEENL